MKNIVFIPTYYYLSNPLFFILAKKISDNSNYYFNTNDPACWKYRRWKNLPNRTNW